MNSILQSGIQIAIDTLKLEMNKALASFAISAATSVNTNGALTAEQRAVVSDEMQALVKEYKTTIEDSVIDGIANTINNIFVSDNAAALVGWSKRPPIGQIDLDTKKVADGYGNKWPIRDIWTLAQREFSNLSIAQSIDKYAQKMFNISPQDTSEILVKFANVSAWSEDLVGTHRPMPVAELMPYGMLKRMMTEARQGTSRETPEGTVDNMSSDMRRLYDAVYSTDVAHLAYEFSLPGGSRALHHALYMGHGDMLEVQNIIINKHVTGLITPSTLLNFLHRTERNGSAVYIIRYSSMFNQTLVRQRAFWTIGKINYNVFSFNCENFVSWVLTNNNSNSTCAAYRTMIKGVIRS